MDVQDFLLLKRYAAPYYSQLLLITGLAIAGAFFEAVNIGALVPLLHLIESPDSTSEGLFALLESALLTIGIELTVINLLIILSCLFIFGQSLLYIKKTHQLRIRVDLVARLKKKISDAIFRSDLSFQYSHKSGNFISIIMTETDQAGSGIFAITEIMTDLFLISVYGLMLMYISPGMTLLCGIIGLAGLYFLNFYQKRSSRYGRELVYQNTRQTEFITERFNLLRLIKTFSTEPAEHHQFSSIADEYGNHHIRYGMHGISLEVVLKTLAFFFALAILFISLEILQVSLSLMLVYLLILMRITAPMYNLNAKRHDLARQVASFHSIERIIQDAHASRTMVSGKKRFTGFSDRIEINNVGYSYDKKTPVLGDISFTIPKNTMVGIAGASGSGKSTLVDLIIRLMDPDTGDIRVDGTDIREFDIASYHAKLGVVSQDTLIFHDTVINNICYGCDRVSPHDAKRAAVMAYAHEFIKRLPEGYDTILGDRGVRLSGGQKQRIALARALYKNPEIIILDEATSSLDAESEKIIQQSIRDIRNHYTIIAIAHRLSTIENADMVLVIEDGRLVESGTHEELLRLGRHYTGYHSLQYPGERVAESILVNRPS